MPLLGILSRSTRVEEAKGATLRVIVLVGVIIARRLSLVRLPVILEKGLRLNLLILRPLVIIL
jgi:hypothetical protein